MAMVVTAGADAHAAPPATLAAVTADLDGNGAPDTVELGADGAVRIAGSARGVVKLAPSLASGRLAVTRYRDRPYVVAWIVAATGVPASPAATRSSAEVVILGADRGSWREILRSQVGGVGLDREYGIEVDAAPDGIYRYQTRGDIRRC